MPSGWQTLRGIDRSRLKAAAQGVTLSHMAQVSGQKRERYNLLAGTSVILGSILR